MSGIVCAKQKLHRTLNFNKQDNRVLNTAKPGHSADPVSAVTKKGKTLLGVKHPIFRLHISDLIVHETLKYPPKVEKMC